MKRVAHLRSSAGMFGAERVILELSSCLPDLGFEPIVVALWDDGDPYPEFLLRAKEKGIKAHAIPCRGKLDLSAVKELRRFCAEERVDILHCHGYKEDIYGLFVGLPKVATNHLWKRGDLALKIYSYIDGLALHFFDRVIAVSRPVYKEMAQLFIPKRKMEVIPNGIDSTKFRAVLSDSQRSEKRAEFSLGDEPVLITVSSLTKEKGHRTLLSALRKISDYNYSVLIVGDGPERESLEREAKEGLLGNHVRFLGARDDIAELLEVADIFLLPSYREGLPIAVLEAMAAGKAIIASNVGDVAFALADGEAGVLVAPEDSDGLAVAIEGLLSDKDRCLSLAKNSQKRIEDYFSAQAMSCSYVSCYQQLLSSV